MKYLIIDNEVKSREVLKSLCDTYCPALELSGSAGSVEEGIRQIDQINPDLIFLDIHLPLKSGFTLLDHYQKQASGVDFLVIFTTAYDQYALEAFRYSAVDYLQKPIDIEALRAAVEKAFNENSFKQKQLPALRDDLLVEKVNKIALTTIDGYTFVKFEEIIRCEAQGNYTYVYLQNGKAVLITKTLKHYEDLLLPKGFLRVHKSHLINLHRVRKFLKGKKSMVEMTDGRQIEVSIKKRSILLEQLSKTN